MPETTLNVKLLSKTNNALSVIYSATRQCYSASFSGDIFDKTLPEKSKKDISDFISGVVRRGHESPLEHVSFTFAIEGVSRALTHQLVRHRIASYSQQSQRYVKADNFAYIIPPSFQKNETIKSKFINTMNSLQNTYNELLKLLEKEGIKGENANQDARFILPQAIETKIVVTMNARELKHFFCERCCARSQWEIRALAYEMLKICKKELPEIFDSLGAKCELLKFCPEGEKSTCGKYPVRTKTI
ncbi:thymidylate synthase, flavin-dependent [Candidatus Omnitrophus magneticus]|uniref:Flavin-dependent thymidylate synthase n=1 Tax=Candidatus Omnitrophus magneticus TaxID=1609969 RepID=A0A0F0CVC3_9BACT|nr:thymidylate synthase, flavin-dependent [Candidatus Omnitrophus magneticus]